MTVTAQHTDARSGSFTFTTTLPPERVFDYLADLTKHPEWGDDLVTIEPEGTGPVAPGSGYLVRDASRTDGAARTLAHARLTALERPRLVAWEVRTEAAHGPRAMRSRWSFEIAQEGTGSRVTQRYAFEPPDAWSRLRLRATNVVGDLLLGGAGASPKVLLRRAQQLQHVLDVRSAVDQL